MGMEIGEYVHGYGDAEAGRLASQSRALEHFLHDGVRFANHSRVLEVGCGTGAQTLPLTRNSPGARFVAVDRSAASLAEAAARVRDAGVSNVQFVEADINALPFPPGSFDHVFVCFVLEHMADPLAVLTGLRGLLRAEGTITVIEGDHGTAILHPDSAAARHAIGILSTLQRTAGGDPCIGRRLHPLLVDAGFASIDVTPVPIYVDGARPELAEAFTRLTFTAMVEGVGERAVAAELTRVEDFAAGLRALRDSAEPQGVFCYTFFKGRASKGGPVERGASNRET